MLAIKISIYLAVLVIANFIVLYFGKQGLVITALVLIPFDFVMRCIFHERWKGAHLVFRLGSLVAVASLLTYLINRESASIAIASVSAFVAAQLAAGIFYQSMINRSTIIKVNGSDLVAIVFDSIVFQWVAFGAIDPVIAFHQITLKFAGGIFWYWVLFVRFKMQLR